MRRLLLLSILLLGLSLTVEGQLRVTCPPPRVEIEIARKDCYATVRRIRDNRVAVCAISSLGLASEGSQSQPGDDAAQHIEKVLVSL